MRYPRSILSWPRAALLALLAMVAFPSSRALAHPIVHVGIQFTKYNIDPNDDTFLGGDPDPSVRVTVGGSPQVQKDFSYPSCPFFPPTGCIIPNPPPQEWIAVSPAVSVENDWIYPVGAIDLATKETIGHLVPIGIDLIDRPNTRRLAISMTANVFDGTVNGSAEGNTFSGQVGQEICAWKDLNGVCFIITGPFGDTDHDGLLDEWERNHVVPTENGDLPLPDSDPNHRDIYLEVDWTAGFQPMKRVIDRLKDAFARAPFFAAGFIDDTQGIRLHVDTGGLTENVGGTPTLVGDNLGGGSQIALINPNWCGLADAGPGQTDTFYAQAKAINFDPRRSGIYHYVVSKPVVNCDPCHAPLTITGATNATPIVITTQEDIVFNTGASVLIAGVQGNTSANGQRTVTVVSKKTFSIDGSVGNGSYGGGGTASMVGSTGCGNIGGPNIVLSFASANVAAAGGNVGRAQDGDAATFMHELGHNLGLEHGGEESHNCKPPYLSVMNYFYGGGLPHSIDSQVTLDYFPPRTAAGDNGAVDPHAARMFLPGLDEAHLDETKAFNDDGLWVNRVMTFVNGRGQLVTNNLFRDHFDWDGNGTANNPDANVNVDINPLTGGFQDCNATENISIGQINPSPDWLRISMRFTKDTDAKADNSGTPPGSPEPTVSALQQLDKMRSASDLKVAIAGPTVYSVGGTGNLSVTVTNNGPNQATGTVTLTVSTGIAHVSNNGGCTAGGAGQIVCPVSALGPGQSTTIVATVSVAGNTTLQSRFAQAMVVNNAFDTNTTNDQASLPIMLRPTVTPPGPVTTDNCGAPPFGTPTGTSELGGSITFRKDATLPLPLGSTVVHWTATDSRGVDSLPGAQTITTRLGDSPSCCPPGTRIILGTNSSETIIGTISNECILGLGGNDTIQGGGGFDFISGGSGNDNITGGSSRDYIWGGAGTDVIDGAGGDDFIDGGADSDNCSGGTGTNTLIACETPAFCNAACCANQSCVLTAPPPLGCQTAYSQSACLSYVQGTIVSSNGTNWECTNGNCANCATYSTCAPGATGCPWGTVWTARGTCP
jgi:hypothetical protein